MFVVVISKLVFLVVLCIVVIVVVCVCCLDRCFCMIWRGLLVRLVVSGVVLLVWFICLFGKMYLLGMKICLDDFWFIRIFRLFWLFWVRISDVVRCG